MSREDKEKFDIFIRENKKRVDEAAKNFEESSKRFDKKFREILLAL